MHALPHVIVVWCLTKQKHTVLVTLEQNYRRVLAEDNKLWQKCRWLSLIFSNIRPYSENISWNEFWGPHSGAYKHPVLPECYALQNQNYCRKLTTLSVFTFMFLSPLNPELNPICYLLALLGAHHFLHVSRIRVKLLTFRLLMSYIYEAPILYVSRSHTTTQHSR